MVIEDLYNFDIFKLMRNLWKLTRIIYSGEHKSGRKSNSLASIETYFYLELIWMKFDTLIVNRVN